MKRTASHERLTRLVPLPWTIELRRNPSGRFFGRIVELPGCMTEGKDEAETLGHLKEALELWLETELERGRPIPQPGEYPADREWDFRVPKKSRAARKRTSSASETAAPKGESDRVRGEEMRPSSRLLPQRLAPHLGVVTALREYGAVSIALLAHLLDRDEAEVGGLVSVLEQDGAVVREGDKIALPR